VAYRSQLKRLLRPSWFALFLAALAPPFVVGCRSSAQQDLVAREMRMQEDQIYALEDYVAQYQQLICQIRAENAALKQELAGGDELEERQPRRRTVPPSDGPAIEVPPRPRRDVPPVEIEVPEVPTLEDTTLRETDSEHHSSAPDGEAALAVGEFADNASVATLATAIEPSIPKSSIHDAWLHGEVVENNTGGPRLIVEIEPLDENNQSTAFVGRLSLMLLSPDAAEGQESLARWDFSPEDVKSARQIVEGRDVIQMHLELSPETPLTATTQLWVRLLPPGGEKVLAFADVDLHEPGNFSSFRQSPIETEPTRTHAVATKVQVDPPQNALPVSMTPDDDGWSIARPGELADLERKSDDATSEWRASDEPMPVAVARRATPKPRIRRTATRSNPPSKVATPIRRPTSWSPDRPGESSSAAVRTAKAPNRPSWSATR
jgi:hypothetical protein